MIEKMAIYEDIKRIDRFDDRWYQVLYNGEEVDLRSVTTFLKVWPKGYALINWMKSTGHNADYLLNKAAEFGSHMHRLVELVLKGEKIDYYGLPTMKMNDSIELWERFLTWCQFWKTLNEACDVHIDPSIIEFKTYNIEHQFAGTIDLPLTINGEDIIIDWKFGNFVGESAFLQISAYAISASIQLNKKYKRAWIINIPSNYINRNGWKIIEVRSDDMDDIQGVKVSTVTKHSIQDNFKLFKACQGIYWREHPNEKPKYKNYPTEVDLDFIKNNDIIKYGLTNGKEEVNG